MQNKENRFLISSDDCELLIKLQESRNLLELAEKLNKDVSVVSRLLKSSQIRTQAIEKSDNKWVVNSKGERLIRWAKEAILSQKTAIQCQKTLRIGCTREFSTRILIPNLEKLIGQENAMTSFVTSDRGVEHLLLSGHADVGFDCGRPNDPSIAFRKAALESFVRVATPKFLQKNRISSSSDLDLANNLKFTRTENIILDLKSQPNRYFGTFNDLATLRKACLLGYGWATLPYYSVVNEIKSGHLVEIPGEKIEEMDYGVWWNRDRLTKEIEDFLPRAKKWLKDMAPLLIKE